MRPPIEEFRSAIDRGDANSLRSLLEQHAEVRAAINEPIFGFDAPALLATGDNIDVVNVLLEFGADPNRRSDWWAGGFHPLHGARGVVAERLLAAGSIPDACAAANLDRVDLLAQMLNAEPGRVHERGGDGKTPLHFARSLPVVDLLLAAGADVDARDIDHRSTPSEWMLGDSPNEARHDLAEYLVMRGARADIFLAAALGLTDVARELLDDDRSLLALRVGHGEYGEKPPSSYHIYLWTIGSNLTPLQTAAKFGQEETLHVMRQFASPVEGLLLACHRGDREEAHAIVAANPRIVENLDPDDARALTDAAWAPNPRAVELMLELGFDPAVPSVSGPSGGNALHCAAWEGSVESVAAILSYPRGRALIDVRESQYNGTPLSWCCHGSTSCGNARADHGAVARLLIDAGASVDTDIANWGGSESFRAAVR